MARALHLPWTQRSQEGLMEVSAFLQSGCRSLSAPARLSHAIPNAHGTKRARSEGCDFFFLLYVMLHTIRKIYQRTCLSSLFQLLMSLNMDFWGVSSVQTQLTWEHSVIVKHRQLWNTAVCTVKRQSPDQRRSPSSWRALPSRSLVSHPLHPQRAPSPYQGQENICRYTTCPCSHYTPYTPSDDIFSPSNHSAKHTPRWVVSRKEHRGGSRRYSPCSTLMADSVMGEGTGS